MRYFFRFPVKTHFLLKGLSIYLCQVVIQLRTDVLLSWITENKGVSSTNSLAFKDNPSDKSLIYINSNNGPSIEPWGTPDLTSDQLETCPFDKTLCFLFLRKSHKRSSKLRDIIFPFNLKMTRLQYL